MKIKIVFDLTGRERLAIAHFLGQKTQVGYLSGRSWIESVVDAEISVLLSDLEAGRNQPTQESEAHDEHDSSRRPA